MSVDHTAAVIDTAVAVMGDAVTDSDTTTTVIDAAAVVDGTAAIAVADTAAIVADATTTVVVSADHTTADDCLLSCSSLLVCQSVGIVSRFWSCHPLSLSNLSDPLPN